MNAHALARSPVDIDALADDIAKTAACIDAATHTLITQIRTFDEVGGWGTQGALSCAHWLNWRIGLSIGAAREHVRVARALATLPAIDAAFAAGEVSFSKVRAMTRVATAKNEADLLEMARYATAAQLERICRFYRGATAPTGEDARATEDRRWVSARETADGMVSIQLRLHPDEAQTVRAAIRACAETAGGTDADGAVAMAEAALRGESASRTPVDVSLHVSAETLEGHYPTDGTGVSAETCRRLCCDAGLAPVVLDRDGGILDVGRKTRTIPAALKRALASRDGGCRFPGCDHAIYTDGHHVEHWIDGGETSLENCVSLCRGHHRYVHEFGYGVRVRADGDFEFLYPDGTPIPAAGFRFRAGAWDAGVRFRERWPAPPASSNRPRGDGRADYARAVDVLLRADRPTASGDLSATSRAPCTPSPRS